MNSLVQKYAVVEIHDGINVLVYNYITDFMYKSLFVFKSIIVPSSI